MPDMKTNRESARQVLFSGYLDVEGMDDVLALYRDLFELSEKIPAADGSLRSLTDEEANMRLAEGFTLVDVEVLLPDPVSLASRVSEVVQILGRYSEDRAALEKDVANLHNEHARLSDLGRIFLREGEMALRKELHTIEGVNPEVVLFILFNALKSSFIDAAERYSAIDTSAWEKGSCPVCDGEAAVAYTMGEGGKRYLICSRCERHWRYRRLACPYCGHEDPKESGYLFSEDEAYRMVSASTCKKCKSYIKGWRIDGDELGDINPQIEDLMTPGFDRAIEAEGYSRGAPNICGVWIGAAARDGED